ncbi:competence/damage-inducible protein A [Desulfogranum mediterraneum]|uniref:competence/damage-inducible protein A n=1 Tax=Desulfogranum mediterraneum TaxID=160661 RepID=UPI000491FB12|nr:competence/damage-inducible protein A [Desulfogranum mediterraneum]
MEAASKVEILTIGNELLIGDILDTNTNWLCRLLHDRGSRVARVTILPDIHGEIVGAVAEAVERQVTLLLTTGGLGPTEDDRTLEAVAAGTGRRLRLHQQALAQVEQQYARFFRQGIIASREMNPAREKMAWLPEGAEALANPVGIAPGVLLQQDQTTIVSLPGVPAELKGIMEQEVGKLLGPGGTEGSSSLRRLWAGCNDESLMDPVLRRLTAAYPEIYIKSLATPLGEQARMEILLTCNAHQVGEQLLAQACLELAAALRELGLVVAEAEESDSGDGGC